MFAGMRPVLLASLLVACTPDPVVEPVDPTSVSIEPYDPLALVDPFIGTGGIGAQIANVNPGASWPTGMTLLGPDTRSSYGAPGFYHCAGYHWVDTHLHGFSHTHAHGMGVPDYGTIPFMPRDGWDPTYTTEWGREAPFSHEEEEASPGWYRVTLGDTGTEVELTASIRGGHSRVTWAAGAEPVLIFDMGQAIDQTHVDDAWLEIDRSTGLLVGYQRMAGAYSARFGGVQTWFEAQLSVAPTGGGGWEDREVPVADLTRAEGARAGLWLSFPEGTTEVEIRLAISTVDGDGAAHNLAEELSGSFEDQRAAAEDAWRELLGGVRIGGGSDADRRTFHTALYHSLLMPSRHDDADGRYRGVDQQIHTTDHPYYSDLSLWDTFRTLHPWYVLAWPDLQQDVLRSLLRMSDDGGSMPRWPLAHGYTGGMVGTPATQLFAGSWLKGLRDWDETAAFDILYRHATEPMANAGRAAIGDYVAQGWLPVESVGGSVSRTLEYAWSDHALALWGRALGRDAEAEVLETQASGWPALWHEASGFLVGKHRDGTWAWEGNAFSWDPHFVEGDSWHYVWGVPQDVEGMIRVQHGGDKDAFLTRLSAYWEEVYVEPDDFFPDDYYWHGNEPVMHYAFLGSLAGRPDLTAEASRWVLAHRYSDDDLGLDGNDDSGTLSAWYLLAASGLFPIAGTEVYAVGSPLFERLEIDQPDGEPLVIRAAGTSAEVRYVTGLTLGGEAVSASQLDHTSLMGGRELVFSLDDAPAGWGE